MNKVWFDGRVIDENKAIVPVTSAACMYGTGIFEGIRGYLDDQNNQFILGLQHHLSRLENSARLFGYDWRWNVKEISDVIKDLLHQNRISGDFSIKISLLSTDPNTSWSEERFTEFIAVYEADRWWKDEVGPTLGISSYTRINENSLSPRIKANSNYISGRYAVLDAQSKGFLIPILLNADGSVSETPGASLVCIINGELVSVRDVDGVLNSITLEFLFDYCRNSGIRVSQRKLNRYDLYTASEIALVGTRVEITPCSSIDRFELKTKELRNIFEGLIHDLRNSKRFLEWKYYL